MTTTEAPPVSPSRLNTYRDAALTHDASLDTALAYLREIAKAREVDLVADDIRDPQTRAHMARVDLQMRLTELTHFLATGFDAEVRAAPASGLAEAVREVLQDCVNPLCGSRVAPWAESAACEPDCMLTAHRLGEI